VRGQWFYATDDAARNYVWFHSVHDLVRRSIEAKGVDVVDLGPSGSDAFSVLKERYGFLSVDDWVSYASPCLPYFSEKSVRISLVCYCCLFVACLGGLPGSILVQHHRNSQARY
jgi:hypothetical protein